MKNLLNLLPTSKEWEGVSLNNSKARRDVLMLSQYVESNWDALFEAAKVSGNFTAIEADYYAGERIQHAHSGLRLNRHGIKYCPKYEDWRGHKSDTQDPITVDTVDDIVGILINLYNDARTVINFINSDYDKTISKIIAKRS